METMEDYYRKRAAEYEEIYRRNDPVRQAEQQHIAETIKETFRGRNILEIACGTGFWTQFASETAQRIVATDIVEEVLAIAQQKQYHCPAAFQRADAYNLPFAGGSFDGGLANAWLSHVPRNKIDSFLKGFHSVLQKGSRIFIMDNVFLKDSGGKLVRKDGDENTYKLRTLNDGSKHLILKNYFSVEELAGIFSKHAAHFTRENIFHGTCFWYVQYEL